MADICLHGLGKHFVIRNAKSILPSKCSIFLFVVRDLFEFFLEGLIHFHKIPIVIFVDLRNAAEICISLVTIATNKPCKCPVL